MRSINAILKNYWLKEPSIGLRRIIFFYLIIFILILISHLVFKDYFALVLLMVVGVIITIYLGQNLINKGYYHRLEEFESLGEKLEVIDFILPSNRLADVRTLNLEEKEGGYSSVFLNPKKSKVGASYDFCRLFAKLFLKRVKRALVLGGGGLSVPISLAKNYPEITIDVVEIDPKIIAVSKKYFIPDEETGKKINFINADAFKFVKTSKAKYQFIFNNLFVGTSVPQFSRSTEFVNQLKTILGKNGILVVNPGRGQTGIWGELIKRYAGIFEKLFVFWIKRGPVLLIPGKNIKVNFNLDQYQDISPKTKRQAQRLFSYLLWEVKSIEGKLLIR